MGARPKTRPKLLLLGFSPCHLTGDQMTELKPFLVRLRPDVRVMLERAAEQHKKSIAAVINDELSKALQGHSDLDTRLSKLLG